MKRKLCDLGGICLHDDGGFDAELGTSEEYVEAAVYEAILRHHSIIEKLETWIEPAEDGLRGGLSVTAVVRRALAV